MSGIYDTSHSSSLAADNLSDLFSLVIMSYNHPCRIDTTCGILNSGDRTAIMIHSILMRRFPPRRPWPQRYYLRGGRRPAWEGAGPLIIDHTCTDLSRIPAAWIDSTKAKMRMYYGHTSHGEQITEGLRRIEETDPFFAYAMAYRAAACRTRNILCKRRSRCYAGLATV